MIYNFDELVDRRGTHSSEYDVTDEIMLAYGWPPVPEDYIALGIADMDFHCAESIKTRLQKVVDWNLYGYCMLHPGMVTEYYSSIIDWNKRRFEWDVEKDEIFYTPGVLHGITSALNAVTEKKDKVLLLTPVYTPFYHTVRDIEREVVKSAMINDNGYYTVNWEDFEEKVKDPQVTAFILCHPHNPVGRVWTKDELLKMYSICVANNVIVISDEIHGDIVRKGVVFEPLSKLTGGKGVITCTGPNKSFNLAGLQASHIIVQDEELKPKISDIIGSPAPNPFVIEAVIGAYNDGEEWLEQVLDYLDGNIAEAIAAAKEKMPKAKIWHPEGTYILWIDLSAYGVDDDEIFTRCYSKAGVEIQQGREFDEGGHPGFVRIVTATQRSRLLKAIERIAAQFE